MNEQSVRTAMLLGETAMDRLAEKHVAVFGIGGVGGFCAEALARAGVGELTLVDDDVVSVSNLNRQLVALRSTIGMAKTEVMEFIVSSRIFWEETSKASSSSSNRFIKISVMAVSAVSTVPPSGALM